MSTSFDTVHCRAQKPVLIRGPSVWIERLSSPINPLPFASPLSSQVAALRSYHTRVCDTDSAHLSLLLVAPHDPCPCVASAHPVPCTQTALPCRRAFSPVNVGRCLCGTPSTIPHASSRRPVTRASRRRACIRSCEDKFTQRTPRYLRHYRCPSRNATFRS